MTSNINVSAINVTTPVVGTRYSASDERGSRVAIKNGLQTAATEITALQNEVANISSNFTGIVDFTDGGGFTGNVTNNNLSLMLQNANATQNGQLTSTKFVEIGNATSDISTLQTALSGKQATLVSATNIKTINGVSILGSGDMVITGGNVSGIAGFTDGGGFTGTVTNNSLSLAMQYANATQDGQLTADKFNEFSAKGTSNLTIGSTNITAFAGDLGADAVSNISVIQGNVTGLQNLTTILSSDANTTNGILSGATSNITTLQGNVTNLTSGLASKGTSNLTAGNTTGTAFDGALGIAAYNHTSLTNNPHNVTKTQIGLPNVTDVTPLELPVSNATQSALDLKLDASQKGASNGVAELVGGAVPASQLPSYVDDVVEVANFAALPVTGEVSKIYVTLDTELLYRWTGSTYGQLNGSLVLGETSATAYRGDRGLIAYNHSQVTHDKSFVGLGNVSDVTSLELPISNLTAAALTAKADKSTTINGVNLSSNITLTTANISASTDKNYISDFQLSVLNQTAANSNVTYVQGNGTVNGLTLTGNVTSGGNLTLGGNLSGTASGLTAGNTTNIPNLTGAIAGNATGTTTLTTGGFSSANLSDALTNKTGTGLNVFDTNCTLVTPALGTPSAVNLTNAVSLPIDTGITDTAWVSWTPTFTNFTLGNGTVDAKYKQIGKTVFFRVRIVLGSTSSMGTSPYFTNPVTSIDYADISHPLGFGMIVNNGISNYQGLFRFVSTATIGIAHTQVLGSLIISTPVTATSPHTWKDSDRIVLEGFYEAA